MTGEELKRDRETCERATPGPWRSRITHQYLMAGTVDQSEDRKINTTMPMADCDFIASARTRWPAALAEIDRLRAENDASLAREGEQGEALIAVKCELVRVRGVLAEVLDAPVAVNDNGATVRVNLEIQRATRDLCVRASRAAMVKP